MAPWVRSGGSGRRAHGAEPAKERRGVHHAEVALGRATPALGAGAADRVRYGCKVDRSREELAPARYWPVMKIMWAAVTRAAQSISNWPSVADRVGPEVRRRLL